MLRVSTEGVPPQSGLQCVLAGQATPATWASPTALRCAAPPANGSAAGCAGAALEVALAWGHATRNGLPLRRVATPAILGLDPPRGYYRAPQWVRLRGYGYVDSRQLSCRFSDAAGRRTVVAGAGAAYRGPTEVACLRPALPAPAPAPGAVEVSLDGQAWSAPYAPYVVVGDPVALLVPPAAVTVAAAAVAPLPALALYAVDGGRHRVLEHDPRVRAVTVTLAPAERPAAPVPVAGAARAMRAGRATLARLTVARPRAGPYTLTLSAPGLGSAVVPVYIRGGAPAALYLVAAPTPVTDNAGPLPDQPVLGLRDSAGNVVQAEDTWRGQQLRATVVPRPAPPQVARTFRAPLGADGRFRFRAVRVVAAQGVAYRLNFSLPAVPAVPAVLSPPIAARACGASEFYVAGDTACRPCLAGAVCNGTAALVTADNHWRAHGAAYAFFECGAARPCVGGAAAGACRPRFRGPLCALCVAGHAGEACAECGAPLDSQLLIAVLVTVYFVGVGFVILQAVGKEHDHRGSALMPVFKVALGHLQVWARRDSARQPPKGRGASRARARCTIRHEG